MFSVYLEPTKEGSFPVQRKSAPRTRESGLVPVSEGLALRPLLWPSSRHPSADTEDSCCQYMRSPGLTQHLALPHPPAEDCQEPLVERAAAWHGG